MSEKLQKVLARLGLGSRRELDSLIASGRIEVNGVIATVGMRVDSDITVKIDNKVVATPQSRIPKCRVLMYYKPEGELTTYKDPQDRPTVFDHLPRPDLGRWIYVGRLDLNTSGLLLFTTDGELANALMHPKNEVERVYAARIYGEVTEEQISKLTTEVMLEDGPAKFDRLTYQGGEGRNQWYHVSLKEGRNREVRKLWESVGLKVSRLIRIKYANITLDEKLKTGAYRELSLSEINNLRNLVGLKALDDDQIAYVSLDKLQKDSRYRHEQNKKVQVKFEAKDRNSFKSNRDRRDFKQKDRLNNAQKDRFAKRNERSDRFDTRGDISFNERSYKSSHNKRFSLNENRQSRSSFKDNREYKSSPRANTSSYREYDNNNRQSYRREDRASGPVIKVVKRSSFNNENRQNSAYTKRVAKTSVYRGR